jgi:hypothetical protein
MIKAMNEASQLAVTKMVEEPKVWTANTMNMGVHSKAWFAMKHRGIMQGMEMATAATALTLSP